MAALLSPLAPVALLAAFAVAATSARAGLAVLLLGVPIAYLAMALVGLPGRWLLRRSRRVGMISYVVCGALAGSLFAPLFIALTEFASSESLEPGGTGSSVLAPAILFLAGGAIASLAFWVIERPDRANRHGGRDDEAPPPDGPDIGGPERWTFLTMLMRSD